MNQFTSSILKVIFLVALLGLGHTRGCAQQKQKYNIGIFLYEGVELLDFAGPGEAFSATPDFNVYTLSVDGKELVSQGFVTIKPQYSMDDAPIPDIIVFPGGGVGKTSTDQKVLHWINALVARGTTAMSVCNGAVILAGTGLLNGLTVTTHHSAINGLRKMLSGSTVLDDAKYVDNGNIITAAGVSSGIEGALHVISRIKGRDIAKSVAYYMEYNKWKPEEGMTIYKNETIEKWKNETAGSAQTTGSGTWDPIPNTPIPYEGELKNLAMDMFEKEKFREAANVMEQTVKWYPNSQSSYKILGQAYAKLGKPAPMDQDRFLHLIDSGKCDEAIAVYEKNQKNFPGWPLFDQSSINSAGYRFLDRGDYTQAIKIFSLNIKAFPTSWNAWDSYAEAYMKAGNRSEAIKDYNRSLELNPKNDNARTNLNQLASK